jgi:carboxyl-terminal processing protease
MDDFSDGASLKYTIGKRFSPSGKTTDKEGIAPDVIVEFDPEAYTANKTDNQLEKAKELLK